MSLYESVQAVASASGDETVDWDAVARAAKAATDPGRIELSPDDEQAYAADVRAARERIRDVSALSFDVPETVEIQNRHHWIDANVETFRRVVAPLEDQRVAFEDAARTLNTATTAAALAFVSRHVMGQYDPLLLGESDVHRLYFVHPNLLRAADELDVDFPRFRRWIAFHEVTHAAEFGAAPWLDDYLAERVQAGMEAFAEHRFDSEPFRELNRAMTAVEGYAELLMDEAFDDDYDDLRRKLDERRGGGDPITKLFRRLLGFQLKREQYERGRAFFEAVVDARGVEAAGRVWDDPAFLPTEAELENPSAWLARVPESA
ncbi:zinc-dependent metalloprotease [Halospeciosus flavus]|uniref:Zinc-dependent metalloprotease n=1 Tax=Halospeciosus flavus TaxID=3032283 RepID=A0ABD5Z1H5_9EURY|nr:zinc-dependent metalloprotease [Halospeciosus flavus]